eukprot:TRINITY_DN3113_c3_g1_i1.p1 TRINITY_DN3113_c3_g1~~TRINITY_DN3113_c3_g1_i1.p1  ORF type:complete len:248 (+),score=32.71 TRINITY_DN3113_c3_g1_i1:43-786(+)
MSVLTPEVSQILRNNEAMKEIYQEIGDIHADTIVSDKHGWAEHIIGPHSLSTVFNSPIRVRPHQDRVLMEMHDPFYVFQGAHRVTGSAWMTGMLTGGVNGLYKGLRVGRTRSWKSAYSSLFNFSVAMGPQTANRFASATFMFCMWEAVFRQCVLSNNSYLDYEMKTLLFGHLGEKDHDKRSTWQTDGRLCAVPAAAVASLCRTGGLLARPEVAITNAVLAAIGGYCFSHLWCKEDYFDVEKKFMEDM